MSAGLSIRVRGTVQGVGFRPFVFRLAERHGLTGWVRNTAGQVEIEVDGASDILEVFLRELRSEAPAIARIDEVQTTIRPAAGYNAFAILVSHADAGWQAVSPDIATCDECLAEIFDAGARRFHYPFTNCTNCGPRFTIIESLPYDRARTTMRSFPMCEDCRHEFENPRDRRFHAQPIACPRCGPKIWLHVPRGFVPEGDTLQQCVQLLREGSIVAIKGLGGFHLACDAANELAVSQLRERKRRYGKPFAVMVGTVEEAGQLIEVAEAARQLLLSRERPIVVARSHTRTLAPSLAPGLDTLGVMLPYTPLHHLLLRMAGMPLVMTSGNLSEEPIATGNEEALQRLAEIADAFLLHNRDIYSRYDDSVVRTTPAGAVLLRRARSMAPAPLALPFTTTNDILAVGPQQKNTFCLLKQDKAFISQHLGDMDSLDTSDAFNESLDLYARLFKVNPTVVAHDMHPDYYTTAFAGRIDAPGILRVAVQHHHAHIVSCMVENGLDETVIGVAYDGTGYGTDDAIWGSEIMVASWQRFERLAHLRYVPLIGGEAAVRNPLRMAASWIWSMGAAHEPGFDEILAGLNPTELTVWHAQFESALNAPATSSCGRFFDAAAAILGVRSRAAYEGQPAIELEAIADANVKDSYEFDIAQPAHCWLIDPSRALRGLMADMRRGRPVAELAAVLHNTVAAWTVECAAIVRAGTGLSRVCLSGGCFQNSLLLTRTIAGLSEAGFEVFTQTLLPPNDGGISLGQATVAWAVTQGDR